MNIDNEMLDYIGVLARLEIKDENREKDKENFNKIIGYMDILNELDTSDMEAISHAFPVKNVFRKDEVRSSVERENIILNAPNKKEGCFKVPKTVE